MRNTMLLLVPLALAGCQTWGPTWSEVTGERYFRAEVNRTGTIVESVDGRGAFPIARSQPVRIEPGKRTVTLQALSISPGWLTGTKLEQITLDAEPCKRYYVNADFDNRLGPRWKPVIDYVEPIAGCDPNAGRK